MATLGVSCLRRVYKVDPFLCCCGELMRVIGFITQATVIRKILSPPDHRVDTSYLHLGLQEPKLGLSN